MKDRVPKYPGRFYVTPEDGSAPYHATIERADEPAEVGTPLNKATLLSDITANELGFQPSENPTVNDAFNNMFRIGDTRSTTRNYISENWLLCNGQTVRSSEIPELKKVYANDTFEYLDVYNPTEKEMYEHNGKKFELNTIVYFKHIKKYAAVFKMVGSSDRTVIILQADNVYSMDFKNDWELVIDLQMPQTHYNIHNFAYFKGKYVLFPDVNDTTDYYIFVSNEAETLKDVTSFTSATVCTNITNTDHAAFFHVYNDRMYLIITSPTAHGGSVYITSTKDLNAFSPKNPKPFNDGIADNTYDIYPIFYKNYLIYMYTNKSSYGNLTIQRLDLPNALTDPVNSHNTCIISRDAVDENYGNDAYPLADINSCVIVGDFLYVSNIRSDQTTQKGAIIKLNINAITTKTDYLDYGIDYTVLKNPIGNIRVTGLFNHKNELYAIYETIKDVQPYYIFKISANDTFTLCGYYRNSNRKFIFDMSMHLSIENNVDSNIINIFDTDSSIGYGKVPLNRYLLFYGELSAIPEINIGDGINTFIKYKNNGDAND